MHANLKLVRRTTLALLVLGALAGCASGPAPVAPELVQRIETARTRADHESLASYYTQEAVKARETAALHRRMAKSYQVQAVGGRAGAAMPAHCNAVAQSQEGVANSYDGMAVAHRQMADEAKP